MKTHPKSFRLLSGKLKDGKFKNKAKVDHEIDQDLFVDEENDNTDVTTFSKFDQFINQEIDPSKTNALRTGLWELYTLKNHFCSKVRKLVKRFERDFTTASNFELETFGNVKETDFLYTFNEKTVIFY
jgi:hypothetical protein